MFIVSLVKHFNATKLLVVSLFCYTLFIKTTMLLTKLSHNVTIAWFPPMR